IAFVVIQVKSKAPIEHEEATFPARTVEVITVEKMPFRARALAFGNVEPAVLLKSKSEVSGKISYRHPELKKGASIKKGTVVLRIEPTSYKFSLNQSKAGLASSQSSLKQLETEEKSTRRSLNIAQKNLNVGLKELGRIKQIWNKRLIARSALDAEEQKVLQLRAQVEEIKGKLASYTSRKAATKAQITQSRSQVNQSKDTLGRTEIRLPFDARIGTVFIEKGEFVSPGGVLFEASGTQAIEITAQLPTRQFRPLLSGLGNRKISFSNPADFSRIVSKMKLQADVSLVNDTDKESPWQGELVRISESIDPTRDTIGLVVAVNNPYSGVIPGKRPPLLKGMYTAVEFLAPSREALVIPRKAMHQGRVYLVDPSTNKLMIKAVEISHRQGDLVIIKSGLKQGDQLIISDVIPVIEGLPLKPILNQAYEKSLRHKAARTKEKISRSQGDKS
ncbi:MAG TPA: efflux RND transporter periplasmic adaptor subunit, partial [Leucothrix mucor]|nr:efflux RND transporter periplasmic adaptor subunit [Leucothrix mucor]